MWVPALLRRERDSDSSNAREIVSYLTLRRLVGVFGVSLWIVLLLGSWLGFATWQPSISEYYGTPMRNFFVGVLFTVAWFLFTYRGYDLTDERLGELGCLSMLGVALFPATSEQRWVQHTHLACAEVTFTILALFSLWRFTRTHETGAMTDRKRLRNRIYTACGALILVCLVAMAVYKKLIETADLDAAYRPVFWLEATALSAFSFSWWIKGNTWWKDPTDRG